MKQKENIVIDKIIKIIGKEIKDTWDTLTWWI